MQQRRSRNDINIDIVKRYLGARGLVQCGVYWCIMCIAAYSLAVAAGTVADGTEDRTLKRLTIK